MDRFLFRIAILSAIAVATLPAPAIAQDNADPLAGVKVPGLQAYAPARPEGSLAGENTGWIRLEARLTAESPELTRGMVWRVFRPQAGPDGKLEMVATGEGGSGEFQLEKGSYLVHAAFGRAGATKRITVGPEPQSDVLVLDAGGLILNAVLPGDFQVPANKLRFSIYEAQEQADGERALIIPNVAPGRIVRLNTGTYHVVSTYGKVNAVIRSDIRVEAGKLTEATVEHRAAQLTLKLVRENGGEAIADTAWSVETESGDIVRESVGAFSSIVLAEGTYTINARHRDNVYTRTFQVVAGRNQDVEVIATE